MRITICLALAAVFGVVVVSAKDKESWPPEKWLLQKLADGIPAQLRAFDPATGKFGTKPWICNDQNRMFPIAVAWWYKSADNPYYHDPKLLEVVAKAGDALIKEQDKNGMWIFRKKDNSTWGMIHMPWTYSRWARSFMLMRDAFPPETRTRWEVGLKLGYDSISRYCQAKDGANILANHAMGLYAAGVAFDNPDWRSIATNFLHIIVAKQSPDGYWSEHFGPVVNYNYVYIDALGAYYGMSHDATVLPALQRAAKFHCNILWPDGSSASAIDERNPYSASRSLGNAGFSWSPEGRGYLLSQLKPYLEDGRSFMDLDYIASMLLHGGSGEAEMPATFRDKAFSASGDGKMCMFRFKPWQICLSAYACQTTGSRWYMDRQNMMDVFLDDIGLVAGGGNTRMQPLASTFTFGDTNLLKPNFNTENPSFTSDGPLKWTPTSASIDKVATTVSLSLDYDGDRATLKAEPLWDGVLRLTYTLLTPSIMPCEGHLPVMRLRRTVRLANGKTLQLNGNNRFRMSGREIGGWFQMGDLRVEIPNDAAIAWPVEYFTPYSKKGKGNVTQSKLTVCMPLSAAIPSMSLSLRRSNLLPEGTVQLTASKLQTISPSATPIKPLPGLGSFLMAATAPGESMSFAFNLKEAGTYEVYADFVTAESYGIVTLSVDTQSIGKPFDAYSSELDSSGPTLFGKLELPAGKHNFNIIVVGKNPKATHHFISVKSFFLRKLP